MLLPKRKASILNHQFMIFVILFMVVIWIHKLPEMELFAESKQKDHDAEPLAPFLPISRVIMKVNSDIMKMQIGGTTILNLIPILAIMQCMFKLDKRNQGSFWTSFKKILFWRSDSYFFLRVRKDVSFLRMLVIFHIFRISLLGEFSIFSGRPNFYLNVCSLR